MKDTRYISYHTILRNHLNNFMCYFFYFNLSNQRLVRFIPTTISDSTVSSKETRYEIAVMTEGSAAVKKQQHF